MVNPACVTANCNSFLDKIVQIALPGSLVNFLNTSLIYYPPLLILNIWSIVHVFFGLVFFLIWKHYSKNLKKGFFIWIIINVLFEGFELVMAYKGLYELLFKEEITDIIWDIVASLSGYYILWKITNKNLYKRSTHRIFAL